MNIFLDTPGPRDGSQTCEKMVIVKNKAARKVLMKFTGNYKSFNEKHESNCVE